MGYLHCCGKLHKARTFKLVPLPKFIICELDFLKHCPVCGHTVVQLTRVTDSDELSTIRKINDKALKFFDSLKSKILYEKKYINYKYASKFYLNYNEFGVKKRCYANLSALKIGLAENR